MSWLFNLFKTYEENLQLVGNYEKRFSGGYYALLPLYHSSTTANIEVIVNENGDFLSAKEVDKEEGYTIFPGTEDSLSRAGSTNYPHPLHDQLKYVAGDYDHFGGDIKFFEEYIKNLKQWCDSRYTDSQLKSIYQYLSKRTLISDLLEYSIVELDDKQKLKSKYEKMFVRFDVHKSGEINTGVWRDKNLFELFIKYHESTRNEKDLCYITGKNNLKTEKHPKKIYSGESNAKLISANTDKGFTYTGRFRNGNQVANVSYEVSQKAHNSLTWLIQKQGMIIDKRAFLVWGNDITKVPSPHDDPLSFLTEYGFNNEEILETLHDQTHEEFARKFNQALKGYKKDLTHKSEVNILVLDAATTGRLAVLYYRNIQKQKYIDKLEYWHNTCSWLHRYRIDSNKKVIEFIGAPSSRDIAFAAYGDHASKKIIKGTIERLLPCVVDQIKVPLDIIRSAYYRASNPVAMEKWEWEKTLSIACALIKKHYEKEDYQVGLDTENTNRDYLFGRLLAIADVLERRALSKDDTRASNAIRYMNAFSKHPARTWGTIQANLQPYQARLGDKALYYNRLIDEVASKISFEDFNNKPLSGVYLLGFYSQRHDLYQSKKEKEENMNGAV